MVIHNWLQHLAAVIRYHRKRAGLTQSQLALMAGVGKTVVYDIEHGKPGTQLKTLLAVAATLNISLILDSPLMTQYEVDNA